MLLSPLRNRPHAPRYKVASAGGAKTSSMTRRLFKTDVSFSLTLIVLHALRSPGSRGHWQRPALIPVNSVTEVRRVMNFCFREPRAFQLAQYRRLGKYAHLKSRPLAPVKNQII